MAEVRKLQDQMEAQVVAHRQALAEAEAAVEKRMLVHVDRANAASAAAQQEANAKAAEVEAKAKAEAEAAELRAWQRLSGPGSEAIVRATTRKAKASSHGSDGTTGTRECEPATKEPPKRRRARRGKHKGDSVGLGPLAALKVIGGLNVGPCSGLSLDESTLHTSSTTLTHVVVAGPDMLISCMAAVGVEKAELRLALSPFEVVNLPTAERAAANIPHASACFAFVYPIAALKKVDRATAEQLQARDNRNVDLLTNGGFVYVDKAGCVCGVNAIYVGDATKGLRLDGPYPLDSTAAASLRATKRFERVTHCGTWHPCNHTCTYPCPRPVHVPNACAFECTCACAPLQVTLHALVDMGALSFSWVKPDEHFDMGLPLGPVANTFGAFAYTTELGGQGLGAYLRVIPANVPQATLCVAVPDGGVPIKGQLPLMSHVSELKAFISAEQPSYRVEMQALFIAEDELDDHKQLEAYGIKAGDTVHITLKLFTADSIIAMIESAATPGAMVRICRLIEGMPPEWWEEFVLLDGLSALTLPLRNPASKGAANVSLHSGATVSNSSSGLALEEVEMMAKITHIMRTAVATGKLGIQCAFGSTATVATLIQENGLSKVDAPLFVSHAADTSIRAERAVLTAPSQMPTRPFVSYDDWPADAPLFVSHAGSTSIRAEHVVLTAPSQMPAQPFTSRAASTLRDGAVRRLDGGSATLTNLALCIDPSLPPAHAMLINATPLLLVITRF